VLLVGKSGVGLGGFRGAEGGAAVQRSSEVQRCRGAEVHRYRDVVEVLEMQRCRGEGGDVQMCRGGYEVKRGCRSAEVQRCRGDADVQVQLCRYGGGY
jgi:hypothetical protein